MIIVGIILIVAGIGLVIGSFAQSNKLYQMKATETSTAAELTDLAKSVAQDIGAGSFNQVTEVKGKVLCDNPLTSELAQARCVYYSMRITREYEEEYWDTDSQGRRVKRTRTASDTVASNTRSVHFLVEDKTGKIKVDPSGASFVAQKAFSRFEPGDVRGPSIKIGSFSINLSSVSLTTGRRTIGYRYEEEIIPLNQEIYVLGEALDSSGELRIQKPSGKDNKFIISVKSEEELVRNTQKSIQFLRIGGIICGIGGIVVTILAFLNII